MTLASTHRAPLHGTGLDYFSIDRAADDRYRRDGRPTIDADDARGLLRNHAHDIVTEQQVSALLSDIPSR